jgi:hypothetical protein
MWATLIFIYFYHVNAGKRTEKLQTNFTQECKLPHPHYFVLSFYFSAHYVVIRISMVRDWHLIILHCKSMMSRKEREYIEIRKGNNSCVLNCDMHAELVLGTWKERKRKENKRKSGKEITHVDE